MEIVCQFEKKKKIMVFNKLRGIFNLRIPFKGKVIEHCSRYDYLGTTFTRSGSFYLGRKILLKRQVGLCFNFSAKLT